MTNFLLMRHEQKSYVEFLAIFCKVIAGALRSCFFVSLPFTVPDCYKGAGSSRLRGKRHMHPPQPGPTHGLHLGESTCSLGSPKGLPW